MAATLVLSYPCQDDTTSEVIDDVSATNVDGFLAGLLHTETYSVAGPGGSFTKALQCVSSVPVYPYVGLTPTINWGIDGGGVCFCAKRDSASATDQITGEFTNGSKIWFTADGKIKLTDNSLTTYEANLGGVTTTSWHHYGIFDITGELWLYVNGVARAEFSGMPASDSQFAAFGHDDNALYANMAICGIKVRNGGAVAAATVLSDAEEAGLDGPVEESPTAYGQLGPALSPLLSPAHSPTLRRGG